MREENYEGGVGGWEVLSGWTKLCNTVSLLPWAISNIYVLIGSWSGGRWLQGRREKGRNNLNKRI